MDHTCQEVRGMTLWQPLTCHFLGFDKRQFACHIWWILNLVQHIWWCLMHKVFWYLYIILSFNLKTSQLDICYRFPHSEHSFFNIVSWITKQDMSLLNNKTLVNVKPASHCPIIWWFDGSVVKIVQWEHTIGWSHAILKNQMLYQTQSDWSRVIIYSYHFTKCIMG